MARGAHALQTRVCQECASEPAADAHQFHKLMPSLKFCWIMPQALQLSSQHMQPVILSVYIGCRWTPRHQHQQALPPPEAGPSLRAQPVPAVPHRSDTPSP